MGRVFQTMSEEDVVVLAKFVHRQTEGNLFFVKHLLASLLEQGVIDISEETGSFLDSTRLEARAENSDVVHFIVANLRRLEKDMQSLLRVAACLGVNFSSDLSLFIPMKHEISSSQRRFFRKHFQNKQFCNFCGFKFEWIAFL